ncbi:GroES-like protein [Atractiella rhizophila]|nr:GroES-like protein [Atractiella rhizophila]
MHKAAIIPSLKGGFIVQDLEDPVPKKGQVLIKAVACALNPVDAFRHDTGAMCPAYPIILGSDVAGIVEELGEGVSRFKKGDRVWLIRSDRMAGVMDGCFRQYVVLNEDVIFKVPNNVSFEEAATMPCCLGTAMIGLFDNAPQGIGLNPSFTFKQPSHTGEKALVIRGSSSVGQFGIQLLRWLGFTEIAAYASEKHSAHLLSLGATKVLDHSKVILGDLRKTISNFDVVLDGLSTAESQAASLDCLKEGGKMVNVMLRFPEGIEERLKAENKVGATVYGLFDRSAITKAAHDGLLQGNRYEILPGGLSGIEAGIGRIRNKEVSGIKLVARPFDE